MPLVDITLNPHFSLRTVDGKIAGINPTKDIIKQVFARAVPYLLVENAERLRIGRSLTPEAVQVRNHDFGPYDINTPDVWVLIHLAGGELTEPERMHVRDRLYDILKGWFSHTGWPLDSFVLDIFWCQTNGRGTVNGVELEW